MNILYEDDEIIVVYKEAGLPVQTRSVGQMDLESILLRRLASGDGRRPELYVVHRIDQPVEGLVLFAKTKEAGLPALTVNFPPEREDLKAYFESKGFHYIYSNIVMELNRR